MMKKLNIQQWLLLFSFTWSFRNHLIWCSREISVTLYFKVQFSLLTSCWLQRLMQKNIELKLLLFFGGGGAMQGGGECWVWGSTCKDCGNIWKDAMTKLLLFLFKQIFFHEYTAGKISIEHCNEVDRYGKKEAGTGEHLNILITK